MIPAGAYRNREFAQPHVCVRGAVSLAMEDILYDPQTSGGLLLSVDERDANELLARLQAELPRVAQIGYVTGASGAGVILE
jgi:selenide,water dikinase